jgi:hypothetical protein
LRLREVRDEEETTVNWDDDGKGFQSLGKKGEVLLPQFPKFGAPSPCQCQVEVFLATYGDFLVARDSKRGSRPRWRAK